MARTLPYLILNVFCPEPAAEQTFSGNPLAVFPDARGLTPGEMQALALQMNLSETCFCLPGDDLSREREEGTAARIFTTAEELPFAGHPTLGTATALRLLPGPWHSRQEVRLRLAVGTIPVRFDEADSGNSVPTHHAPMFGIPVRGVMEQRLPRFGRLHAVEDIAPLLGLPLEAFDCATPIQTVSTGTAFAIVLLRSADWLQRLRLQPEKAAAYLQPEGGREEARFFYVLAPESEDGIRWRARMQFYRGEDPATGSAAGCATAYLVEHGRAPQTAPLRIAQGAEIGRSSLIETSAFLGPASTRGSGSGSTRYVRVGGRTIAVAEGRFFLA